MKKIIIFLTIFLCSNNCAIAAQTTLYHRSDRHTINQSAAYKLLEEQSDSAANIQLHHEQHSTSGGNTTCHVMSSLYIKHADNSETSIASNIAPASLYNRGTGGWTNDLKTVQWNLNSDISLSPLDAIKIVVTLSIPNGGSQTAILITEQLGWIELKSGIWTFYYYLSSYREVTPTYPQGGWLELTAYFRWGNSTYASMIERINYIGYEDIGIRVRGNNATIKIGVLPLESFHKFRIRKGDTTYGIPLLDTDDNAASAVRIYDGSNIKALPKVD